VKPTRMAPIHAAQGEGRRKQCPPHGPLLKGPLADGGHFLRCLSCGHSRYEQDDQGAEAPNRGPDRGPDSLAAAS
jgi:hypothetical protein